MSTITIDLKLEPGDLLRAQYLHYRPRPWLRNVYLAVVAALFAAIVYSYLERQRHLCIRLCVYSAIAAIYLLLYYFALLPWKARRIFRQQKGLHHSVQIELRDDGLFSLSPRGSATVPWADLLKWKENKHLLLLYHSDVLFHMLPKRCFPTAEALSSAQALLRDRLGRAV
jgi:hypothetical protein